MIEILIFFNFLIHSIHSYNQCNSSGLNSDAYTLNTLNGNISGFCSNVDIKYGNKPTSNDNLVLTWLSVPYAEPPLGNLRFKYAKPKKSWLTPLDGTNPPNRCIQYPFNSLDNEDCLYLNIYVPYNSYVKAVLQNNKLSRLPVYVWIHGGGFSTGSANLFDGSMLAAISNVIVVVIQYRLGVFGFLHIKGTDAIGNLALLDQNLALKWVYSNAERLGGDRQRITIGGESAGGWSVGYHLIFKSSWPYFSSAIIQSASPIRIDWETLLQSPENATSRAYQIGSAVGCNQVNGSDLLTCLQSIDKKAIVAKAAYVMSYPAFVLDVSVINQLPQRYFETGDFKKCNILIGYNNFEEIFLAPFELSDEFINSLLYGNMTTLNLALQRRINIDKQTADQIIQTYVPVNKQNDFTVNYYIYFNIIITDYQYKCPTFQLAEYMSRYNKSVYAYVFAQRFSQISTVPPVDGAAHSEELFVVFGDILGTNIQVNIKDEERVFGEKLVRYWGNFIAMNRPSLNNEWLSYTEKSSNNLFSRNLINLKVNAIKNTNVFTYDPICKFWNSLVLNNYS